LAAQRGDDRNQNDNPLPREKFGRFGHATDILRAVFVGKSEITVQPGAQVIPVENHCHTTFAVEHALDFVGDG
jgi:hypothetical protein